ncbi:MAG: glycosyltransferase family 2 protein [Planctomycetaceae bacterium]|nr:glycosyltransferase family 2 protein [Planctomycetaceae bacterium]
MPDQYLTALPVFDEVKHVDEVLNQVRNYSEHVLVIDDGSTDGTGDLLKRRDDVRVLTHAKNQGYGAALISAFAYAQSHRFEYLVTIDCDGQHVPQRIPAFVEACAEMDLVSGSRYLQRFDGDSEPPTDRRRINQSIASRLNQKLGLQLTDAFCGFKAYRVSALNSLRLTEHGYAMPLELWVQAAKLGWRIKEYPVPLIYLDENRSFGGALDDNQTRLDYYNLVVDRSLAAVADGARLCGAAAKDVE